jgi:hypothetical protein
MWRHCLSLCISLYLCLPFCHGVLPLVPTHAPFDHGRKRHDKHADHRTKVAEVHSVRIIEHPLWVTAHKEERGQIATLVGPPSPPAHEE